RAQGRRGHRGRGPPLPPRARLPHRSRRSAPRLSHLRYDGASAMRSSLRGMAFVLALALSAEARAQGVPDAAGPPAPPPPATIERPWLYTVDPTGPAQGQVLASLGIGYAAVDHGATRPFAADRAHAGAVFSAGAEVGVFRFASIQVEGLVSGQGPAKTVGGG